MSQIRVDEITDEAGTGAPNFPNGATGISGYEDQDALDLFNVTGSAPVYACRAWVNFDGTSTVAIRASGNVSSITDNGTGDYTVNFTTAMPDADYAVTFGTTKSNEAARGGNFLTIDTNANGSGTLPSTTSVRVRSFTAAKASSNAALQDNFFNYVAILR